MKHLVELMAKALVDHPESVVVEEQFDKDTVTYLLTVAPTDMGKVIGKQGRIAKALRTVVSAAGSLEEKRVYLEIR